jgi:hypothetical protein
MHLYPDLITCLALLVYLWTFVMCGKARGQYGVVAPATTGHPEFEKRFRIQQNTMEQLVLFLPSLWVFSTTVSQFWSGIIGLVWVVGRIVYGVSYARNPASRGPGFMIAGLATIVLLGGATIKTVMIMVTGMP